MLMAYTKISSPRQGGAYVEVKRAVELNPNLPEAYSLGGRLAFMDLDMKGAKTG